MSELLAEDDPDPLPRLKHGLHYYRIDLFLSDIVKHDSVLTQYYRELCSSAEEIDSIEVVNETGFVEVEPLNLPRSRGLLRRLGRYARTVLVE